MNCEPEALPKVTFYFRNYLFPINDLKENAVVKLQKRKVYFYRNIDYHTVEITVLGLQKINVKLLKSKVLSCIECRLQIVGIAVV